METRAYCDNYLEDAQYTMGNMMDYALNICGINGEEYFLDKSPEFWCGWILAYYQWRSCMSFKRIYQFITIEDLLCMYPTHHEAENEESGNRRKGSVPAHRDSCGSGI